MAKKNFYSLFSVFALLISISVGSTSWTCAFENEYEPQATFYVDPSGSDDWSGRLESVNDQKTDGPFATLQHAQLAVREYKQYATDETIVIQVASGTYTLAEPLTFTSEDSGLNEERPIIWRAKEGANVQINGGVNVTNVATSNEGVDLSKIREDIRSKIVVLDLSDADVLNLGQPATGTELFFQGAPMTLSRYPNEGFVTITAVEHNGTTAIESHGRKGIAEGILFFDDEELCKNAEEEDLWASGYWFWDWSQQYQKVQSLDVETKKITLEPPHHGYGYIEGQWFYILNTLTELDVPGEFYIDRQKKLLYFYPPTEDWKIGDFMLTNIPSLLVLKEVSNLIWSGFEMLGSQGDAVSGDSSTLNNVSIRKCDVHNIGGTGIVLNGYKNSVEENELWNLGKGGVYVTGGDRATLTPGNNSIVQNYIHDYARIQRIYAPGISTYGVGNYIAHNCITDAPHMGMGFGGNEQLIEFNEIYNVCYESNDAGVIYAGRNWTMRGNILRNNYIHDVSGFKGRGCVGIYLDDMFSSADIVGNLFVNVTRAAMLGGGRDCSIVDNVFVDCLPALHIDARGIGWAYEQVGSWIDEAKTKGTISGIAYDQPPYSERYPELASIFAEGKTPGAPEGNTVSGNICIGGAWDENNKGQWIGTSIEAAARPLLKMENNFYAEADDGSFFVDRENGDFRLKDDSALYQKGYRSLPIEEMGITSERMKARIKR